MASTRIEFELVAVGDREVSRALDSVSGKLEGVQRSAGGAGISLGDLTKGVGLAAAAIAAGAAAAVKLGEEFERQSGIINALQTDISEATDRINGFITQIDLMTQANRLSQAGLNLTQHSFANLAVAAEAMAGSVGKDTKGAFEELSQALIQGEAGALRRYGFSVEGLTDKAQIQTSVIAQLQARYGGVEASADTLAGQMEVLKNSISNVGTELFDSLSKSEAFGRAMTTLGEALGVSFGDVSGFATRMASTIGVAFEETQRHIQRTLNLVRTVADQLSRGNLLGAAHAGAAFAAETIGARDNFGNRVEADIAQIEARRAKQRALAAQNAGIRSAPATHAAGGGGNADVKTATQGLEQIRSIQEEMAAARLAEADRETERLTGIYDLQVQHLQSLNELRDANVEKENERLNGIYEHNRALAAKEQELIRQQQQDIGAAGAEATELLVGAFQAAQEEHKSLGVSIKESLDAWLASFAKQELFKGGSALAEAIGALFFAPSAAANLFASAGQHFALAAAAGGAAAAIPGGGGRGGGGATSSSPVASVGGKAANNNGAAQTVVININSAVMTEAEGGRAIEKMRQAARREGFVA